MTRYGTICVAICLTTLVVLSCSREPTPTNEEGASLKGAVGAVIDLGSDEGRSQVIEGFSSPEQIESRHASWSEGETSTLAFSLRGKALRYLLTFLAEPYFRLQPVSVKLILNNQPLAEMPLLPGWNAYSLLVEPTAVQDGNNELTLRYSKTGRPADSEPGSSDAREISVRFDQIQIQPLTERVRLIFDAKNASSRAALREGWAIDASDRSPGIWTVGTRSELHLWLAKPIPRAYMLEVTAHSLTGVASQSMRVLWNGKALGTLAFTPKRSAQRLQVPADALHEQNELLLESQEPKTPNILDPKSKDTRLLGIRVLKLEVFPAS